jgi:nucleotide-binding universal stress UspA family protein
MIKTILVPVDDPDGEAASFAAALALARQFGAHIDALHVRLDPAATALALAADPGSGALTAGLIERMQAEATQREAAARERFDRFCRDAGLGVLGAPPAGAAAAPSAEWHVETGEIPRWVAEYGLAADLILAARSTGDENLRRAMLEAALLGSGRPLLIPASGATAQTPQRFERIAIGWKPNAQAARAVALAMPLIEEAREIVVLSVKENGDEGPEAERLVRALAWHGKAARAQLLHAGPQGAATLFASAREAADLLVMGGYGHGRLREWVFGGFTESALAGAPLPVLIAH